MEAKSIEDILALDRIGLNQFLDAMDRKDMEKQIRKMIIECRRGRRISITEEQFIKHFVIAKSDGKRGRPKLED